MKYYLIYFLDYKKNDSITIKENHYLTKEDATNNVERIALEYVKEMQGKQQADICKQTKSLDEICNSIDIKNGMYIFKSNDNVILYEKTNLILEGKIWNSQTSVMDKLGMFSVTDIEIDDNILNNYYNINPTPKRILFNSHEEKTTKQLQFKINNIDDVKNNIDNKLRNSLLSELKDKFSLNKPNYGLKNIQ